MVGMNRLTVRQRAEVLSLLCEGCSIASVTRHTGAAKMTILSILRTVGYAAGLYLDRELTGLACRRVQCDEVWSFCQMKEKRVPDVFRGTPGLGDVWLWLAIDVESKLVITYRVGCRGGPSASAFIADLADRLTGRIQLSTDGHRPYIDAVASAFGGKVDYAMIAKAAIVPDSAENEACAYAVFGRPDPNHINTSAIERYNLTVRMTDRRYTRKTNAFSKSIDNHIASVALHVLYYNFVRIHATLETTPAVKVGLAAKPWYYEDMIELADRTIAAPSKPSGLVRLARR